MHTKGYCFVPLYVHELNIFCIILIVVHYAYDRTRSRGVGVGGSSEAHSSRSN
jgi:hypothetical protein